MSIKKRILQAQRAIAAPRLAVLLGLLCLPLTSHAGVDLGGKVMRIQLDNSANLWFKMDNPAFDTYCKKGWFDFNLYVPKNSPDFPYIYSTLMTALESGKPLYLANISTFNGSTPCDLTKTGYGIVIER